MNQASNRNMINLLLYIFYVLRHLDSCTALNESLDSEYDSQFRAVTVPCRNRAVRRGFSQSFEICSNHMQDDFGDN